MTRLIDRTPRARRVGQILIAAALVAVPVACGEDSSSGGAPASPVMASTSIVADLVRMSTCGELTPTAIIPPGADAHHFEPDAKVADQVRSAKVLVTVGLDYEESLARAIRNARDRGARVAEIGTATPPRTVDGEPDPHVWLDPSRMADALPRIRDVLAEAGVGPERSRLDTCLAEAQRTLRELDTSVAARISAIPAERRVLVTSHKSLGYYTDRYGLEVVGSLVPSAHSHAEPSARDLDATAEAIRNRNVRAVFTDLTGSPEMAEELARRSGLDIEVVGLATEALAPDVGADTYPALINVNTDRIVEGLTR